MEEWYFCPLGHLELPYSKCSKISNIHPFLFSNKMLVIMAGSPIMFVGIANREDLHQTVSSGSVLFGRQLVFQILEHLLSL